MSIAKVISWEEVQKHNTKDNLWMIIDNKVYDLTKFRNEHPGGEEVLDELAGKDGSKDFKEVGHSEEAKSMMPKYLVGELEENSKPRLPIPIREIVIVAVAVVLGFAVVFAVKRM